MNYSAVLHKEDDLFVAYCPEIGTTSQGINLENALENLKEATELYLEEFPVQKKSLVFMTSFELENVETE